MVTAPPRWARIPVLLLGVGLCVWVPAYTVRFTNPAVNNCTSKPGFPQMDIGMSSFLIGTLVVVLGYAAWEGPHEDWRDVSVTAVFGLIIFAAVGAVSLFLWFGTWFQVCGF